MYMRKWKDDAVSPVIATILMVAITVVLAAVLYLLVSGLISGGTQKPTVSLTQADLGTTTATVDVGGIDQTGKELSQFKAILLKNNSGSGTISPLSNGASNLDLSFTDIDGGGTLSAGDRFTITIVAGTDYELILYFGADKLVSEQFETL